MTMHNSALSVVIGFVVEGGDVKGGGSSWKDRVETRMGGVVGLRNVGVSLYLDVGLGTMREGERERR